MTNVSTQQARQRLQSLPANIKEVVFAEKTSDIIHEIAAQNHIPSEKVSALAMSASLALLGFIHAEDVGKEVRDRLNITTEAAAPLANDLIKKLFAPIRSSLDAVYAPPSPETAFAQEPPPAKIVDLSQKGEEVRPLKPFVPSPKPVTGAPAAGTMPRVSAPVPIPGVSGATQEASKSFSIPSSLPQVPGSAPAPFMIHEEAKSSGVTRTPDFHIDASKGFHPAIGLRIPPPPPKPARLELGKAQEVSGPVHEIPGAKPLAPSPAPAPRPSTPNSTQVPSTKFPVPGMPTAPRVVHYSESSTPVTPVNNEKKVEGGDQKTGALSGIRNSIFGTRPPVSKPHQPVGSAPFSHPAPVASPAPKPFTPPLIKPVAPPAPQPPMPPTQPAHSLPSQPITPISATGFKPSPAGAPPVAPSEMNPVRSSPAILNPASAHEEQVFVPATETTGNSASNGMRSPFTDNSAPRPHPSPLSPSMPSPKAPAPLPPRQDILKNPPPMNSPLRTRAISQNTPSAPANLPVMNPSKPSPGKDAFLPPANVHDGDKKSV